MTRPCLRVVVAVRPYDAGYAELATDDRVTGCPPLLVTMATAPSWRGQSRGGHVGDEDITALDFVNFLADLRMLTIQ